VSSHLRHCPKHRKPLPCSHCALAAKPAPVVPATETPEPAPALVIPTHKKMGRPPRLGVAMTPAERKAASRLNRKQKEQDAERRRLIAELMKIYRRQQSRIVIDARKTHKKWEDAHKAARQHERQHLDELTQMSLAGLQSVLGIQTRTPDTHGRLHNERSGETERGYGQSEIERILAAQQHDASLTSASTTLRAATISPNDLFIESEQERDPNHALLAAGHKSKPKGCGPTSFEVDKTAEVADATRRGPTKPVYEPTTREKWKTKAIESLVSKIDFYSGPSPKCAYCQKTFLVKLSAENHLEEQYGQGERDLSAWWDHAWTMQQVAGDSIPFDSKPRGLSYVHYVGIRAEMDLVKSQARKKPSKKPKRSFVTSAVSG
jgi:hypothetical protein